MEDRKYHTLGTDSNYNRKLVEQRHRSIPSSFEI